MRTKYIILRRLKLTYDLGFYLPTLLEQNVGFDNRMARLLTAVSGTIYFCSAFGSIAVIDHVGRRRLVNAL